MHSTDGPQSFDAAEYRVSIELVVLPVTSVVEFGPFPVTLGAHIGASVGDGGQVLGGPNPGVSFHGPGTASASASGAIDSVTAVRVGP